jgi:hypothetical protein
MKKLFSTVIAALLFSQSIAAHAAQATEPLNQPANLKARAEQPHPASTPDVPGLLVAGAILMFARWRAGARKSKTGEE